MWLGDREIQLGPKAETLDLLAEEARMMSEVPREVPLGTLPLMEMPLAIRPVSPVT